MSKRHAIDTPITDRRVYVLPRELVLRIGSFSADRNCQSEVEAVRRLLTSALDSSETGQALERRLQAKSWNRDALLTAMSMHPLVVGIEKHSFRIRISHKDGHIFDVQVKDA